MADRYKIRTSRDISDADLTAIGTIGSKQDTLVSGTYIKNINGDSVLGSGNLVVTGTGGVSAELAIAYAVAL